MRHTLLTAVLLGSVTIWSPQRLHAHGAPHGEAPVAIQEWTVPFTAQQSNHVGRLATRTGKVEVIELKSPNARP